MREILREYLYFLDFFKHKEVYFGDEEEDKRDNACYYCGIKNDFFERYILSAARNEVNAHRPAEHAEHYVEHHHVNGGKRIVVGKHFDKRNADKSAVGKQSDKRIYAGCGFILVLYEYQLAYAEEQEKSHGGNRHDNGEVAQQAHFGHGLYKRPVFVLEHAQGVDYQHRLAHVKQNGTEGIGGFRGKHFNLSQYKSGYDKHRKYQHYY